MEALEVIDVAALVRQCVDALRPLAQAKEIEMQLGCPAQLRFKTRANAVQSVMVNLVSNAIDHTPANGRIHVSCQAGSGGRLELEVADSGPGIRDEDLPSLFEPFYRGDTARVQRQGHLGLGLFLVRSHVVALGGQCKAGNGTSGGAVFEVVLPAVDVKESRLQDIQKQAKHVSATMSGNPARIEGSAA